MKYMEISKSALFDEGREKLQSGLSHPPTSTVMEVEGWREFVNRIIGSSSSSTIKLLLLIRIWLIISKDNNKPWIWRQFELFITVPPPRSCIFHYGSMPVLEILSWATYHHTRTQYTPCRTRHLGRNSMWCCLYLSGRDCPIGNKGCVDMNIFMAWPMDQSHICRNKCFGWKGKKSIRKEDFFLLFSFICLVFF